MKIHGKARAKGLLCALLACLAILSLLVSCSKVPAVSDGESGLSSAADTAFEWTTDRTCGASGSVESVFAPSLPGSDGGAEDGTTNRTTGNAAGKPGESTAAGRTTSPAKTTAGGSASPTTTTQAATAPMAPGSAKFSLKAGRQYMGHVKTLFEYSVYDEHSIVQGGTFDGAYYYAAMIDNKVDPETTYLFKFDLRGNLVRRSPKLVLDHANDITYVKKWNALLVSHCQSTDGHYNRYSLVNPDTFAVTRTEDLPNPFFGMDYCAQRDSFASARWGGETIDLWNGDLTPRQSFSVDTPPGTSQGVAADANYLYFARYNPNSVQVYDWNGNHAFSIPLDMTRGEPEHISIVDGVMYIGGNNSTWTGGYFAYVVLEDVTGK